MLSRFDDYPIHQTPEPIAHPATSDRNAYDRYWLNGYEREGGFYFGFGMAIYPHRHLLDAALSVVVDGEQHAFFGSRRAPADRDETTVGPLSLEVVEPMRRLRLVLDDNESGIAGELEFAARTACFEEARQTLRRRGRAIMDATRFTQWDQWQGELRVHGRSLRIEPGTPGTKDRSWGIRPIGEPDAGGAPFAELPQFFFLWAPTHWDDCCTHFGLFEEGDGRRWHEEGAVMPAYDGPDAIPGPEDPDMRRVRSVDWRIDYRKGTRWAERATVALVSGEGVRDEIALEPLLRFQMKGLGYAHPEWGHGRWKGELALGADHWKLDALDPLAPENLHVQQVMRARWGERRGVGVLEQLAIGPHAPSGFTGLLDGA